MRIHLGHHFYGAGNLGDDFMLAGFLGAVRALAPDTSFSACVPFPLGPLQARFPEIDWKSYSDYERDSAIEKCEVWLGLGGSPFQSTQSRWFIEHLIGDAERCRRFKKSMFYLGIGIQTTEEAVASEVQDLCAQASGIWTRDAASALRIASMPSVRHIRLASDLAHIFLRTASIPPAVVSRVTLVANFDYGTWPGRDACLQAVAQRQPVERVWLAQEARELPGAERTLFATLPHRDQAQWQLTVADAPECTPNSHANAALRPRLRDVAARWPSGEWLISSRYHAALAGMWAGSKVVIIAINEKLTSLAREFSLPAISPDAGEKAVHDALEVSAIAPRPHVHAKRAFDACAEFLREARTK